MSKNYESFLSNKLGVDVPTGIEDPPELAGNLFPHQRDVTRLALRRGRFAAFLDTGLGKGPIALEFLRVVAEHTGLPTILLAPLAVSHQFEREAAKFNVTARVVASQDEVGPGINITNYHKLHNFDPSVFGGVAIDESSVLKDFNGKTRTALIESFRNTPFRLALTATPSPNDHTELGNHAEFLDVMTRVEMLSMFFQHDAGDTGEWKLMGHAEPAFWRWVASWAVAMRRPSDLGYDDSAYNLPPLIHQSHVIDNDIRDAWAAGHLFTKEAETLNAQRAVRRASIDRRIATAAGIIASEPDEKWLVWVGLNDEQDEMAKALGERCVSIQGSTPDDERIEMERRWREGDVSTLITKGAMFGHGLNWQHCARQIFVAPEHSFEKFYQCVRRSYRFGQTRQVEVHMISTDADGRIIENLDRKRADAEKMGDAMIGAMAEVSRAELHGAQKTSDAYEPRKTMSVPRWLIENVEAA
jgi:superfamily II DNA or RNA helicase